MTSKKEQLVKAEKVEVVEVLPPEIQLGVASIEEARIKAIAQRQVAEVLASRDDFQPYFQNRRVAQELKKLQSVPQQRSWSLVYEHWGCSHCDTKERPHAGCGMCGPCKTKWLYRKKAAERELSGEKERPIPRVCEDCGRRFPPLTDARWEHIRQKHESSMRHKRKARSCVICAKDFRPLSEPQWEYLRREHERGQRHRLVLRKRKAK